VEISTNVDSNSNAIISNFFIFATANIIFLFTFARFSSHSCFHSISLEGNEVENFLSDVLGAMQLISLYIFSLHF
jgi:hypothetical protein